MPLILIIFSMARLAAEVTTLNLTRNKSELLMVTTDETLMATMDKLLLISQCKPRENFVAISCRAEMIKLILNAGYKPLDARTFVK
jgi:hypothetical protein